MPTRLAAVGLVLAAGAAPAADPAHPFDAVGPLLAARCVSCHGPDQQKGGLRLDSRAAAVTGGDGGPAVVPGNPADSLIVQAVHGTGDVSKMPPKEKLTPAEVAAVSAWVAAGAPWPTPARVLVDDDPRAAAALSDGTGAARVDPADRHAGTAALVVAGQRLNPRVAGWDFPIREHPGPGQYRYLRFAWKKRGGGAAYLEFANAGNWRPTPDRTNAAYVAGPNTTGWAAVAVADAAPADWTVVTRDLWADGRDWGDWSLTGLCATAVDGGEVLLDAVILAADTESLDAHRPGRGVSAFPPEQVVRRGDAWADPANPIRELFQGSRLDLWSLKKPVRPDPPAVRDEAWVRTPVDRFVLATLEAKGLAPSPEADRRTLIRRLTFDLTGLPPAPADVEAFVADPSPAAYDAVVDKLLASPAYGERWARHWLDVVRYADTNGFERDEFRPDMWRYRDWVIRALNQDLAYDQFVRMQLAGDELAGGAVRSPADADRWVATGFLRLGPFDSTAELFGEQKKARNDVLVDLVNTTGAAFLGLTLSCCQCHHHKYDPLSQEDNFRLRAFFAAAKPVDGFALDPALAARNADLRNRARQLAAGQAVFERAARWVPAAQPAAAVLAAEKAAVEGRIAPEPAAAVVTDGGPSAPPTKVLFQGDIHAERHEVPPGFPSVLDPNPAAVPAVPTATTGRRTALADWIAAADNPWTARVAVNRLWAHHFGRGLVATPNDFGFSGDRPSHPELLDWLAAEFAARGWSLKHVHRLMVRSAAYRQASAADPGKAAADPDNRLLWRQNPRRLDAEALRDAVLAVSGKLLPDAGGPPRWPAVPADVLKANYVIATAKQENQPLWGYEADPPERTDVRSVYLVQKRAVPYPFLQPFDLPDPAVSCGCRSATTVAPQALVLLNSPEVDRLATAFADRLNADAGADPSARVGRAFRLAFGRPPTAAEAAAAGRFLEGGRPLVDFCRAVLNANEFAYVD